MDSSTPPILPTTGTTTDSLEAKPPFRLGKLGWGVFVCCCLLFMDFGLRKMSMEGRDGSYTLGYLIGILLAVSFFAIAPAWLVWRFTKRPGRGPLILFYFMMTFAALGQYEGQRDLGQSDSKFLTDMQDVMQKGLQQSKTANGKPVDITQPLLQVLDKQANSDSPDAAAARVISQFGREFQQHSNNVDTTTKTAGSVPMPTDADPSSYDKKIDADQAAMKVVEDQIVYIKAMPGRIDELTQQAKLVNNRMLAGFKTGITDQSDLLIDYYSAMDKTYATAINIFVLMKANQGHWREDPAGRRFFEDVTAQKKYDVLLSSNQDANAQLMADAAKLAEIQKQYLEQSTSSGANP